jgi:hypothetical protein
MATKKMAAKKMACKKSSPRNKGSITGKIPTCARDSKLG